MILSLLEDFAGAAENLRLSLKEAPSDSGAQELRVRLAGFEARLRHEKGSGPKLPFSGD